ncbi:hypothetical protein [Thermomonas fusca]|uniref:hypothetical protein n=1 Tax=Thermomonas fusca TaxID=215690 RepID=UPI0012EBC95C|nr:hypothetical protein [Thermomonas fusca]
MAVLPVLAGSGARSEGYADRSGQAATAAPADRGGARPVPARVETASCKQNGSTAEYLGSYEIISVSRYAGSSSPDEQAKERIGKMVVLSAGMFESNWNRASVARPRYRISCYPVLRAEGEIPATRWGGYWSGFYGFGADRDAVAVLEIHAPDDKAGDPAYWYEIAYEDGNEQLWHMYDGWLYKMKQVAPPRASVLKLEDAPDEGALKQLVGTATLGSSVGLVNYPEMHVSDRILAGLQAAGRVMATSDGSTVTWGFKYEEANLQSVVIADKTGQLELAAVVDDILGLTYGKSGTYTSVAEYEKRAKRQGLRPRVIVFARDQASLVTAYPLLRRWMQANLLGFNASCAAHAGACALMPDLDLPTDVYLTPGAGSAPVRVTTPDLPAASIPLEAFTQ